MGWAKTFAKLWCSVIWWIKMATVTHLVQSQPVEKEINACRESFFSYSFHKELNKTYILFIRETGSREFL